MRSSFAKLFSEWLCYCTVVSAAGAGSRDAVDLPVVAVVSLFYFSHSKKSAMGLFMILTCFFLIANDVEHHVLFCPVSLLVKALFF